MIVRSRRVVTPEGVRPAAIHVVDGAIAAVGDWDVAGDVIDFDDLAILPGVVDTHVHLNDPGREEWEGFATATRAAAAGGITTLVDMPLNSIPATTTREALAAKRAAAKGRVAVDVGFWGGVVPGNAHELAGLVADGVRGFKCFLIDSGAPEFGWVGEGDLAPAMGILSGLGVPLLCHAELAGPIDRATAELRDADPGAYATWLRSRPPEAEDEAIALIVKLVRDTRARAHIVHHSAASALPRIAAARAEGLPLTAETCPHYLHFVAEQVPDGATAFKCAPPIREAENREALWRALAEGTLDLVASDHSPCAPALKVGGFVDAWGGIAGLQLALSVTWTEARRRGFALTDVARWMSAAPARLANLDRKGAIAAGRDADLVVLDPDATFEVRAPGIRHRHDVTPYLGETLHGVVHATFLRGQRVWDGARVLAEDLGGLL